MKAIINTTLYDYHQFMESGYILFDQKIIKTGPMSEFKKEEGITIIDGKDHLVLPNFVNGHSHIYSTFARGISLPFAPKNFYDILKQIWWKLDAKLDLDMIYTSGIVSSVDYIKHGVTTLIDHHASGTVKGSLETLKKAITKTAGLRGILAFETSDRFNVKDAILENKKFIQKNKTDMNRGLFGLHASLSLSDQTLKKVKKNLLDTPIHIHVAESKLDEDLSIENHGMRVVERLERFRLLMPHSIISHAIHVNDDELDLIKNRGCVIAVNVTSNMNNAVGLPDIHAFRQKKIPIIIGNDGISRSMANEYLNVFYTAHLKDQTPTKFTLDDLKSMIIDTYQYASHLLNIELGSFNPHAEADLLMIPYIAPTPLNKNNIFGHLFFGLFHSFLPKHVFVKGNYVLRNYRVKKSLENHYKASEEVAKRLWDTLSKENLS
jgi:cytosine/adenosine deaminase-related metal-dependent hydrolase